MRQEVEDVDYVASRTLTRFHEDNTFVRGLRGPVGSGKSTGCCWEPILRGMNQEPDRYGVRPTRWVIIRNSYRELVDTTIRTFFDWFPVEYGVFRQTDMTWRLVRKLEDGTTFDFEVLFRALDKPQDVKKLLSLEVTGGWVNEAREVPLPVIDVLGTRVGRYPPIKRVRPTWFGIIMDTNPPDNDHWWYRKFEEQQPSNWRQFVQPSGLSEEAENLDNLPPNYYENMALGKDQEWINVYVHGRYGFLVDGKPVYPEYNDSIHSTLEEIEPLKHIVVGIDFGLSPAAVVIQQSVSGQIQVIDELCTFDMGAMNFGRLLKQLLARYKDCKIEIFGDPAGEQRAQTDESTPFQILANQGIDAWPCFTNDFTVRREAVADLMMRLDFNGRPAFLIGPKAITCRKAHAGGYKLKRVQVTGEERFKDQPDKNKYSHVAEALQYAVLGLTGDDRVIGGYGKKDIDYSTFNRLIV